MGLSALSFLLNFLTRYTCTLPEKPTMTWTYFGYRFPSVSEIERGKVKHYF